MFSAAQQLYFSEQLLLNENGLARQAMSWLSSGLPRLSPCGLLRLTRGLEKDKTSTSCAGTREFDEIALVQHSYAVQLAFQMGLDISR